MFHVKHSSLTIRLFHVKQSVRRNMQTKQEELIEKYLEKVIKTNSKINLTRITDVQEAKVLHIEDSLSALSELNDSPEGSYGDLGSGGGFPGVPLGIMCGRKTVLFDSVQKKMKAVEEMISSLGLSEQISCYAGRIEEYPQDTERFTALTARALSSLPSLLELAAPLLAENGRLICLKANVEPDEFDTAINLKDKLGMMLISDREFHLSDGVTHRRILVFERFKEPEVKLPRRTGMAQKKPFK